MHISSIKYFIVLSVSIISILVTNLVLAESCKPTPHRTTGTHYKPVNQQKINISKGVTVSGRILSATNCKPVPGAKVSHWQADKNGVYIDSLRAYLIAGQHGNYKFDTEWPALSTPHIHFIVTAKGYRKVETQWIGSTPVKNIEFDIILEPK